MSRGRESRPEGNRTAIDLVTTNPSIPDTTDQTAGPCPQCLDYFISGHLAGQRHMQLTQEQAAALAAQKFYAMESWQQGLREFAKNAAAGIDLDAERRKPGSAYVPRIGDPRYTTGGTE